MTMLQTLILRKPWELVGVKIDLQTGTGILIHSGS